MKNYSTLFLLLPLLTLAPAVSANADALSLAVDLGSAKQKAASFSESDTSAAITLGYQLNAHWSLNLSYTDFGKVFTGLGLLVTEDDYFETQHFLETEALGLTAQYLTNPLIAEWAFGVRFGLMHVDSDMSYIAPELMDSFGHSRLDSSTALTVGLLTAYQLTEQLDLTVSVDYLAPEVQIYGNSSADVKTTRFALGLKYNF